MIRTLAVFSFLLTSAAQAQTAAPAAAAGSPWMSALPLAAIFFVFFFLLIRPQMKQAKQRQAMLDGLKRGDTVITGGGVIGKISKIVDDLAYIEIAPGLEIKLLKATISGLYVKTDAPAAADKKSASVKNDNVRVSKSKVANDN